MSFRLTLQSSEDVCQKMDPQYDHKKYESEIYETWEKSGSFKPGLKGKPFTIIMPPPNANDPLHIGHARFVAIEDALVRYHRMKGYSTLWLPGSDHAGIETQYVFEKKLAKEGKSRFDFDRETLYKKIWEYVQDNTGVMETQLKRLGASCDWSRFKFTLDPDVVKIVYSTFKKLSDDGLLYRGERIVNFCTKCGTAYSQLEVDYVEREDSIYYLDYGPITIATTRPETIFADVAIAVNPKDKRYKHLIGKFAKIPLINREIPVIADNAVDITFGTGGLKVTPAHDPKDFEIGEKHDLPRITVIDEKGRMIGTPEKYLGLRAEAAREEVVNDLKNIQKLVKSEKITHQVGTCYRDHSTLEPMISTQWFVKVQPLAKKALESIKNGDTKFAAKKYEKIAKHWLTNLKDWNISRQIVWGIRIPAYQCTTCSEWNITDGEYPNVCTKCKGVEFTQDSDTFDTWFSSGQWPFAALKANQDNDFQKFYPTSVMETGYDILPFWVIRMMMLGIYSTGKTPFNHVLLHGLVRDRDGQKISKSKGNVINPIEMADKYGADALRMGLIWGGLVENDISLSEEKINGQKKFANKIWNIGRFIIMNGLGNSKNAYEKDWIDKKLEDLVKDINQDFDNFRLNEAAEKIYNFVWNDLANKYIEENKEKYKNGDVSALNKLLNIYEVSLKLLHPFMPFVTEAIWKEIGHKNLIISSDFPSPQPQ